MPSDFALPPSAGHVPWADPADERYFGELDEALEGEGVDVELLVVGGAVLRLVFTADPGTRRPSRMFGDPAALDRAVASVRGAVDEPLASLAARVRAFIGTAGEANRVFEGAHLRVFAAPPDYALAMKVACLALRGGAMGVEDDIRYLARFMELRDPTEALRVVDDYLNERQRPPDFEAVMGPLLA